MSTNEKTCPACGERILLVARKCRYCGDYLDPTARPAPLPGDAPDTLDSLLLPNGRPASAILAGYLALFAVVPLFGAVAGILALVCGLMARKAIAKDPALRGSGRAWFGIVFGGGLVILLIEALR